MLGFPHGVASSFEKDERPFSMGDLECSGGEDSIFDCQHDSDCDRFALASGVKCFPIVPWCSSLLFENKIICSNEYDHVNSQVICRHSGYSQGEPRYYWPDDPSDRNRLSNATSLNYLNLKCSEGEKGLGDC